MLRACKLLGRPISDHDRRVNARVAADSDKAETERLDAERVEAVKREAAQKKVNFPDD